MVDKIPNNLQQINVLNVTFVHFYMAAHLHAQYAVLLHSMIIHMSTYMHTYIHVCTCNLRLMQ